jgi:hypothetical protein
MKITNLILHMKVNVGVENTSLKWYQANDASQDYNNLQNILLNFQEMKNISGKAYRTFWGK